MKTPKDKSRRSFIKKVAGTAIATSGLGMMAYQSKASTIIQPEKFNFSANDKVRVATIGMGIMGFNNTQTTIQIPGVELAAVCDLYDGHLARAMEDYGKDIFTTRNYKEILDRKDIDAVIIATPDHWHDHISIEAMNKGKAVYCEKPMVHHISEGKAVIKAQKDTNSVFQVGSQRVSSIVYKKAAEVYKSGAIGQLIMVETYNDRHSSNGAWQYSIPTDASVKTMDWKAFLGDAPKHDFDPVRFFRWRNYQDYGTGVAGDLFVHLFSGLHVVLDTLGPEKIYAAGGLRYWKDGRDVPDVMLAIVNYPQTSSHAAFDLQIRVNFVDGGGGGSLLKLVGSEGTMVIRGNTIKVTSNKLPYEPGYGGWDTYETFSASQQESFRKWYNNKYPANNHKMNDPGELVYKAPRGYDSNIAHHTTFYNAIRNGTPIVEDASFGLRTAGPSLATNVSYFEKRVALWDPKTMELS